MRSDSHILWPIIGVIIFIIGIIAILLYGFDSELLLGSGLLTPFNLVAILVVAAVIYLLLQYRNR
jgi:hypothetical protein